MQESPIEQLRRLAAADGEDERKRYKAICDQRDAALTTAVISAARSLLEASGYRRDPDAGRARNNQQAVASLAEYLAPTSLSEMDQRLLALVGAGALFGWVVGQAQEEGGEALIQPYRSGTDELDVSIVHRLARALYRSRDLEPLWQQSVAAAAAVRPEEADLVAASIQLLLAEISLSELDDTAGKMVIDSILGG